VTLARAPVADTPGPARAEPRTLVLIPAYNEREALPDVLRELAERVPQYDVLVVDDGSADGTGQLARAAGVNVVQLPFNVGVGGALRAGFRFAANRGYDRVVQTDADGQHDPTEIATLLAALDDGADMVIGSRFTGTGHPYVLGWLRRGAMSLLRLSVRMLSGHRFTDTTSGFRAFSAPVVELFAYNYPAEFMSDTVEALVLACTSGFRVVEVPTPMRVRAGGVPSNGSLRLAYHYVRVLFALLITATRRHRPPEDAAS
jgi:glycosyltransferase involved in cell wall biosynthesis